MAIWRLVTFTVIDQHPTLVFDVLLQLHLAIVTPRCGWYCSMFRAGVEALHFACAGRQQASCESTSNGRRLVHEPL